MHNPRAFFKLLRPFITLCSPDIVTSTFSTFFMSFHSTTPHSDYCVRSRGTIASRQPSFLPISTGCPSPPRRARSLTSRSPYIIRSQHCLGIQFPAPGQPYAPTNPTPSHPHRCQQLPYPTHGHPFPGYLISLQEQAYVRVGDKRPFVSYTRDLLTSVIGVIDGHGRENVSPQLINREPVIGAKGRVAGTRRGMVLDID